MEGLENIEFTSKDFRLLIDGLDTLPDKNAAGEILTELLATSINKESADPEVLEEFMHERRVRKERDRLEKEALKDEITILKAKLLQLKRAMTKAGILK